MENDNGSIADYLIVNGSLPLKWKLNKIRKKNVRKLGLKHYDFE